MLGSTVSKKSFGPIVILIKANDTRGECGIPVLECPRCYCYFKMPMVPDYEGVFLDHWFHHHTEFYSYPLLARPSLKHHEKYFTRFGGFFVGTDLDDQTLLAEQYWCWMEPPKMSGKIVHDEMLKYLRVTFVPQDKVLFVCSLCCHVEPSEDFIKKHMSYSHVHISAPLDDYETFSPRSGV